MRLKAVKRNWDRKKGSALVLAMMFVLVFALVTSYVLYSSVTQTRVTHRARLNTNSLDGARQALNVMANNIEYIARERPPQMGGKIITMDTVISQVVPKAGPKMEIPKWNGKDMTWLRPLAENDFNFRLIEDESDPYDGYSTARLDYEIISFARENLNIADQLGYEGIGVKQRITIDYIPLYQYAIFYDGDLELHPGPVMTVGGRAHSNSDMYLSSGNSLRFMGDVTAAGRILRWRDENGNFQGGKVEVRDDANVWQDMKGGPESNGDGYLDHRDTNWLEESSNRWDLNVRDRAHGVRPLLPPLPTGTGLHDLLKRARLDDEEAIRRQKFEYQADIIITGRPPLFGETPNPANIKFWQSTFDEDTGQRTVRGPVDNQIVNGQYVVRFGEFYDGQQQTIVRTLDVDMGRLAQMPLTTQNGATVGGASITGGRGAVYVSTKPNDSYTADGSLKDTFTLTSAIQDPQFLYDANGNIVFKKSGTGSNSKGTLATAAGQEGWLAQGPSGAPPGTVNWQTNGNAVNSGRDTFMPAVRVVNGATIPANASGGFAFYTDRPLYIAGDLNSTNRKTAVFAGDSVTITSVPMALATRDTNGDRRPDTTGSDGFPPNTNIDNNSNWGFTHDMGNNWNASVYKWDDWGTRRNTKRNTITNAILIMGNAPSERTNNAAASLVQGSGGAHNVMRYLENWTNSHSFEGSMIVLYKSEVAAGIYRNDGYSARHQYYAPPTRTYNWDPALQGAEPPPGMPLVIEVTRREMQRIGRDEAIGYLAATP